MKNIKFIVLWALLIILFKPLSSQNDYHYSPIVDFEDEELLKTFVEWDIFQLNTAEINEYAHQFEDDHFELTLDLGGKYNWELQLWQKETRSPIYTEIGMTDAGPVTLPRRPGIIFEGLNGIHRENVIITITDYMILGSIHMNGEEYFIEPLSKIVQNAPADYYVVYNTSNVITDPNVTCGSLIRERFQPNIQDVIEEEHQENDGDRSTVNCKEVQIAIATDYGMFLKYSSSVANVSDHVLTITAMMEQLYDDFDLDYIVTQIFVPTSLAADPFVTTSDVDVLLPNFTSWGPSGFSATHDIGQLWTSRNIFGCGSGTGLIGCAYIGVVCGSSRYNVCEDWSSSFNCLRTLSAHEIGHNWNGVHSQATSSSHIMWPTIGCSNTTWGSGNISRINSHITSRTCLTNCASACPSSYNLVDYVTYGTWKYEANLWIFGSGQLSGNYNATYDAGTYVRLDDGFEAVSSGGGVFVARNDGCGGLLTEPDPQELAKVENQESTVIDISSGIKVYPNPFNISTTIEFEVPNDNLEVTMVVTDLVGKEIVRLIDGEIRNRGTYFMEFKNPLLSANMYLVQIVIGDELFVERIVKIDQ